MSTAMIRMRALRAFTEVLDGQQYHGDPKHPDKENGQRFLVRDDAHADELKRLGHADRVETREVERAAVERAGEGEDQELLGTDSTMVGNAADAAAGIFPNGEETDGKGADGSRVPAGGLESNATDNHELTHTLNAPGNARGTPDPDAAPLTPAPGGAKPASPRRRSATGRAGSKASGATAAGRRKVGVAAGTAKAATDAGKAPGAGEGGGATGAGKAGSDAAPTA